MQLDDLVERGGLLLRLAGLIEKGEQLIGARDRRGAELDRVVLFCRDKKVAIFLKQLLGRVPPAFEFRLTENVAQQPTADLRWRRLAAEALENVAHHGGGVSLELDFQRGKVVRFPGEEMVRGNWGQVFRRILQLHRVPLLLLEVDQDLIEEQIPIGDPAEAPALVQAEGAGLELIELCCACGR